jgi:hypothetical protein
MEVLLELIPRIDETILEGGGCLLEQPKCGL